MRKVKNDRILDTVIRARCSHELKDALDCWAVANNVDPSDFLREAVAHYLQHLEDGGGRYVVRPAGLKRNDGKGAES